MTGRYEPGRDDGHGEWDALAVGWTLSALDPEDETRFTEHLVGCSRCTATVRESLHTVADLAYALPQEEPPRRLRRRVLDAAAAEPRGPGSSPVDLPAGAAGALPAVPGTPPAADGRPADGVAAVRPAPDRPLAAPAGRPAPVGRPLAGVPGRSGPDGRPADGGPAGAPGTIGGGSGRRGRRRARPGSWNRRLAAAAAVVLVAGLAAWNVQLHSAQDHLRDVVAQRDALVARLTEAGPARVAVIRGPAGTGSRRATVVVKQGRVGLITEALPPEPTGRTYWLWSLRGRDDREPVPLASFAVPDSLFSACNIEPPAGVDVTRAFAISEEPATVRPTAPTHVVAYGATAAT